ncbi:MAG: 39S ribosomal protein L45 [Burkholderiales bacterium]|jgi:predicted lipid-binding transport protein (Tim44 family)|nr:39S ribosomal protein L45 [Burkholderiales bacterium]
MNKLMTLMVAGVVGLSLTAASFDAEAQKRRLGGGNNVGMKRDAVQPQKPAAPAQQAQGQQTPGTPAAAPAAAGAAAGAAGKSMPGWLGPVAGLMAGGLLAAMFFGGAFDGLSAGDFMMFALLALAAFMVFRLMRSRAQSPASYRMNNGQQVPASAPPMGGSAPRMPVAPAVAEGRIPADFDVQGFVRNAKMSFIRLQAANDAKDLNDIRDYTTPQVYAAVAMQMQERGDVAQRTEVVSIDAQVMQVVTEDGKMIASVRFTGLIREDDAFNPESVDEVWHVEKDLSNPDSSWLIAGIQQVEQDQPDAQEQPKA